VEEVVIPREQAELHRRVAIYRAMHSIADRRAAMDNIDEYVKTLEQRAFGRGFQAAGRHPRDHEPVVRSNLAPERDR
jgi:hypothetical protein